jgi:hypothetical protein
MINSREEGSNQTLYRHLLQRMGKGEEKYLNQDKSAGI